MAAINEKQLIMAYQWRRRKYEMSGGVWKADSNGEYNHTTLLHLHTFNEIIGDMISK